MSIKNKSVRKELLRLLLVFAIAATAEYLVIYFLTSMPVIAYKIQVIMGVFVLAFLIQSAYRIWRLYNLDHPFSENGKHN
ncbi:MAG: hypothetical protein ABJR05_15440 [Balneola sp.]